MIGRRYWIWIWWGILTLGVVGLVVSVYWAVRTQWRNLEEVLRGIGTITISIGMLLLLHQPRQSGGYTFLLAALIAFVLAFIVGRDRKNPPPPEDPPQDPSQQS